jgi:hypothetical protein
MIGFDGWIALAPVAGLAAYCLAHIILARQTAGKSPYFALSMAFLAGLAAVEGISLAALLQAGSTTTDIVAIVVLNSIGYFALAFGYFNFVNLNVTSLRIRMLQEVAESPQGVSRSALLSRYNVDEVVALRIERLVRGGHFVVRDDRFHVGKMRFLLLAWVFEILRYLILGPGRAASPAATAVARGRNNDVS